MASNIRVSIEVDNKQYIADIKAADATTQKFAKNTDQGLAKTGTSFDNFTKRVIGLKSALAGLAFGALGRGALQMADDLQDLSNSTGIAVGSLVELKKALETTGGQADMLPQVVNTFMRSIDDAANGSIKAQNGFAKLGVSLGDLAKMSERDLLLKTLDGITKLSKTEQATAMMTNFGKSFKSVDPAELRDKLIATAGSADKYAASIKRAAELNDQLATANSNLKMAFLEAFSKPIQQIVDFNNKTAEGTQKMDTLINIIKAAGVALVTAFSASVLVGFVASIGTLLRGISAISAIVGLGTLPGWLIAASGAAARFIPALRAIALIASAVVGIFAANQIFDDFASVAKNALQRISESLLRVGADILDFVGAPIQKVMTLLNGGIDVGGAGQGLTILADKLKKTREESEAYQKSFKKVQATAGEGIAVATGNGVQGTISTDAQSNANRPIDTTATQNAISAIKDMTVEYQKQQAAIQNKIAFEAEYIGKSEDSKQLAEAQRKLAEDYVDLQDKLIKKRESLTKDEREQGILGKVINDQIQQAAKGFTAQFDALTNVVIAEQTAKLLEEDRKRTLDNITKAMEQQVAIEQQLATIRLGIIGQKQDTTFQKSLIGKGDLEKQRMDIVESNRKAGLEASRAFASTFNVSEDGIMTKEQSQKLADGLKAIEEGFAGISQQQLDNLTLSQTWGAGWDEAFANYRDAAQNSANSARTYFSTFTNGVEDAIVKFVQTGKLSFKDLANSLIAEFTKSQVKNIFSSLLGMGGSGGGNIFGAIGSFLGFGGGKAVGGAVGPGQSYMVGERGPELFTPRGAGVITPNSAFGGVSNTTVTYNIQAVDASSFKSLVASDPEFIYGVSERGRKNLPLRSRL